MSVYKVNSFFITTFDCKIETNRRLLHGIPQKQQTFWSFKNRNHSINCIGEWCIRIHKEHQLLL